MGTPLAEDGCGLGPVWLSIWNWHLLCLECWRPERRDAAKVSPCRMVKLGSRPESPKRGEACKSLLLAANSLGSPQRAGECRANSPQVGTNPEFSSSIGESKGKTI